MKVYIILLNTLKEDYKLIAFFICAPLINDDT